MNESIPMIQQLAFHKRGDLLQVFCLVALLLLGGCDSGSDTNSSGASRSSLNSEKVLYYFTWSDYVHEPLLEEFKRRTGIEVIADTFSSNEELLAKVQGGVTGYDVVVPSDFMVSIMASQGLLAEVQFDQMPNVQYLEDFLVNLPFDPHNTFSVPYLWGTVGIGYDSAVIADPPHTWNILWDPQYKGKMSMLNDQREVFGMVLRLMGQSMNTQDAVIIEQAKQKLIAQKPLVKSYTSEAFDHMLVSGDVVLAHGWGGPIARAMRGRPSIKYFVPMEGGTIWTDCLTILKSSPRKDLARQFINFLLETEVAVQTSNRLLFASANRLVRERVEPEVRENAAVYPPEEVVQRMEWMTPVGEAIRHYDRAWTELKVY